jgi:hypothetical protein
MVQMMNERIKELAEQAGMRLDKYGLARDAEYGFEDGVDGGVDIYKFAELIVRECAKEVELSTNELSDDYHSGFNAGLMAATRIIKEHFGVQE